MKEKSWARNANPKQRVKQVETSLSTLNSPLSTLSFAGGKALGSQLSKFALRKK